MCDCPSDKNERTVPGPETLTLFEKCPKPFEPGKDFAPSSDDNFTNLNDQTTLKFPIATSCVDDELFRSSDTTTTEFSSESSRIYKFVNVRECECPGEDENSADLELHVKDEEEEEEIEEEVGVECTLAIVKPEAVIYRRQIDNRISEEGFEVYQTRWLQLSPEQASQFYADKCGEICYPRVVAYMSSAPIIVLVLAKQNAIDDWQRIIGPTKVEDARLYYPDSIRSLYGRKGDDVRNSVHGSSSREEAEREIHFFFPDFIIEPLLKDESAVDYLEQVINPILANGLAMCSRCKPDDPVTFLGKWLIANNPYKPKFPKDLIFVPT